jgi:hypothetical protein
VIVDLIDKNNEEEYKEDDYILVLELHGIICAFILSKDGHERYYFSTTTTTK